MITSPEIPNSSLKTFTWEELSKHNTPDDAYVAVRGSVYDITNFINRHPGGEDVLLMVAGKDATQVRKTIAMIPKKKCITGSLHFVKLNRGCYGAKFIEKPISDCFGRFLRLIMNSGK